MLACFKFPALLLTCIRRPHEVTIRATAAVAVLAAISTSPAQAQKCAEPRKSATTEFGIHRINPPIAEIKLPCNPQREMCSPRSSGKDAGDNSGIVAAYQRFRIVAKSPIPDSDWTLTLRDEDDRVHQILTASDFKGGGGPGAVGGGEIWTRFIKAVTVHFDLHARPEQALAFKVTEAVVLPEKAPHVPFYSIKGETPRWQPLYEFKTSDVRAVRRSGDRVGFMIGRDVADVAGAPRGIYWCCSSILLTDTLLLTNWHCGGPSMDKPQAMWRDGPAGRTCDTILVNMAFDDGSPAREARCSKLELTSEALDYAIVRVKAVAGSVQSLATGKPVRIAASRPASGTELRIVHHPECLPKRVSVDCRVQQAARGAWNGSAEHPASEFTHDCDTEGGSSGAPVFDTSGALVGLHHLGFELEKKADNLKKCDRRNKAIHIDAILTDIKNQRPDLHQEIARATSGVPQ